MPRRRHALPNPHVTPSFHPSTLTAALSSTLAARPRRLAPDPTVQCRLGNMVVDGITSAVKARADPTAAVANNTSRAAPVVDASAFDAKDPPCAPSPPPHCQTPPRTTTSFTSTAALRLAFCLHTYTCAAPASEGPCQIQHPSTNQISCCTTVRALRARAMPCRRLPVPCRVNAKNRPHGGASVPSGAGGSPLQR